MATEARETVSLIGSDKVEGTAVYDADGNKIGSIERVMIDKRSGRVSYAVLSFGGFLGIGDDHYPLPWPSLKYNTGLGGYQIMITEDQLKRAPHYGEDKEWNWADPARARAVSDYYENKAGTFLTLDMRTNRVQRVVWKRPQSTADRHSVHCPGGESRP